MERHVRNYLEAFGFSGMEFMPCEVCGATLNDIHHIEPRSKFGSTKKMEQDHISNLIGLCRECHNEAHGPDSREWKDKLKEIVLTRGVI